MTHILTIQLIAALLRSSLARVSALTCRPCYQRNHYLPPTLLSDPPHSDERVTANSRASLSPRFLARSPPHFTEEGQPQLNLSVESVLFSLTTRTSTRESTHSLFLKWILISTVRHTTHLLLSVSRDITRRYSHFFERKKQSRMREDILSLYVPTVTAYASYRLFPFGLVCTTSTTFTTFTTFCARFA